MSIMEQKRKRWLGLIEEFKSSGRAQNEFCATRDIKITTFEYWNRRFRNLDDSGLQNKKESQPRFLELNPIKSVSSVRSIRNESFPNGLQIRMKITDLFLFSFGRS